MLTAAHCVLPGADYKLVAFGADGKPALKDIAAIARHPQFDADAALRHRVTADVALLKFSAPVSPAPIPLAPAGLKVAVGDPFLVVGYGLATPGDGKSGGTVRSATLDRDRPARHPADPPDGPGDQEPAPGPRRLHRRFRRARLRQFRRRARGRGRGELVDGGEERGRLRRPDRRDAARALPLHGLWSKRRG